MIGQCKSGGDGEKHAQGFKGLKFYIHDGHLPEVGSFFLDELELWGNIFSHAYVYFLTSMKSMLKLLN